MKKDWSFALTLFAIAFVQYINTLSHDYVWDDKIVIQENPRVQEGISGIPDLFVKYSSGFRHDQYGYRPIALTSFAIDQSLFGMDPGSGHFMNALYFAILAVVMFFTLKRLFHQHKKVLPLLITVLFIVHPLHVEAVANIKSRDEILAMLFGLLSISFFLRWYMQRGIKWAVGYAICFVLAFLSKENAVTLLAIYPIAGLVADFRNRKKLMIYSSSVIGLGVIFFLVLNYASTSQTGAEESVGYALYRENNILGNSLFFIDDKISLAANALHLLLLYTRNFVYPFELVYYSGPNQIPIQSWSSIWVWISLLLHGAGFVFAIFRFKKYPVAAFGILFYFVTIVVYLQFFQTLSDTMADRFMFMPSLGLCVLLVWGILKLVKVDTLRSEKEESIWKTKGIALGIVGLICLIFSVQTFIRNNAWSDDFTLISTDMERLDNCSRAHYYYASELHAQIQQSPGKNHLENEMIEHYKRSIELSDSVYYARVELGSYLCDHGRFDEGIPVLKEASEKFSQVSDAHFFLGKSYVAMKNYKAAVKPLQKSLKLSEKNIDSYYFLSISYGKLKQLDEALEIIDKARKTFGDRIELYDALGHIYFDNGQMDKSVESTFKKLQFGADAYTIYATVIGRFQVIGDEASAAKYYQEGINKGVFQPGAM